MSEFETNLLRAQLAATWFSLCLQTARDLFGRGYLSLSVPEKIAVDQAVLAHVDANYRTITPDCHGKSGTRRPEAAVWSLPSSRLSAAFNAPAIGDIAVPDASTDEAVWCSDARAWHVALLREVTAALRKPLVSRPTAAG